MKLSIIIPVFNEEKTIVKILDKVFKLKIPDVEKEIIVVDDGSSDNTASQLAKYEKTNRGIKVIINKKNKGKGNAVLTGINKATGDYSVVQDADLEYDPEDIKKLILPIVLGKAKVIYGTRLKRLPNLSGEERTIQFFVHYIGNRFLSLLTSLLYGQWITDMETCYKLFPTSAVKGMHLKSRGFEFEPEITVKLMKAGFKITEIPIVSNPRGYEEGKKLNTVRDGIKALISIVKYRFVN